MKSFKLRNDFVITAVFGVAIMLILPIISCFTDDDKKDAPASSSIVGLWEYTTITKNGTPTTFGSDDKSRDCNTDGTDDITFTKLEIYTRFTSDNKSYDYKRITNVNIINAGVCLPVPVDNNLYYCVADASTYVIEGNKIIFDKGTGDEESVTFTLSGDILTVSFMEGADALVITLTRKTESAVSAAISACNWL